MAATTAMTMLNDLKVDGVDSFDAAYFENFAVASMIWQVPIFTVFARNFI